jgi:hypothetical protein
MILIQRHGASAGRFWSRTPGKLLFPFTGDLAKEIPFSGSLPEWCCTLVETIRDASLDIGGATVVVAGIVATASLASTPFFRPSLRKTDDNFFGELRFGTDSGNYKVYSAKDIPEDMLFVANESGIYTFITIIE